MANLLSRFAAACAHRAWLTVACWAVIVAAVGSAAAAEGRALSNSFNISTRAADLAAEVQAAVPGIAGASGQIVFTSADGAPFTEAQQAGVVQALAAVADVESVTQVVDPFVTEAYRDEQMAAFLAGDLPAEQAAAYTQLGMAAMSYHLVSTDDTTAVATVVFSYGPYEVPGDIKEAVQAAALTVPIDGVQVDFSQDLVLDAASLVGPGELIGVAAAAIVLVVMLGSLVAAGLPILAAATGLGTAILAALAFAGTVHMTSLTLILGIMLGLAVGIDYSLFIINRHRRRLLTLVAAGQDKTDDGSALRQSIADAAATSGRAVVFAGGTVVTALAALNLTGIRFLGDMGTVGAVAVVVGVAVALSFTPAVLRLVGWHLLPRAQRQRATVQVADDAPSATAEQPPDVVADAPPVTGWRGRVGAFPARHPIITLVAGGLALAAMAVPSYAMRLGLTDGSASPTDSTQYRAYKAVETAFGAGANSPLLAVAKPTEPLTEAGLLGFEAAVVTELFDLSHVKAVVPVGTSPDLTMVAFQVVPTGAPSSTGTEKLVHAIRDLSAKLERDLGATIDVTGLAAVNVDMADTLAGALPLYMGVVVGLSLVLMFLAFRSVAVPLLGAAGFMLSFFAAMGATVAVYQWGWLGGPLGVHDPGPILSFLPTVLVGIQFGLAMDYQLFLVSGIRELHLAGLPAKEAVTRGLQANRSVVMAAALIMMSVFCGFIYADLVQVRSLAFGMALGIGLDAFVVRLGLIPAALTLLGEKAWWRPGVKRTRARTAADV
ncbi:MAG: MMPL family transporter [Bifidobacteriaceae bacterium]|jgi:RND superfamily putative drug exporter|nr:MMPL family transporter [Bifidobacteriaceae bacterium]